MEERSSHLRLLENRLGADWKQIRSACDCAHLKKKELRPKVAGIDSEDTSIVVFGSLARDEFTEGSDIDWTLLIDGSADPKHLDVARRVEEIVLTASAKSPGREGIFGTMAFSHELIQRIGGEDDTNRNTTRRILLLLESDVVGRRDAYERVVTNLLSRYILEDRGFVQRSGQFHVPRFMLNDFARYWCTMAVDFAHKQRTRFGEGAAIRNIKLRMSRKLIYVSGLLTCFGCHLGIGGAKQSAECPEASRVFECVQCLSQRLRQTPLEILASTFFHFNHLDETARKVLNAYDGFLGLLANRESRDRLEKLEADQYEKDEVFQLARGLSHDFRDGLLELLFDKQSGLFDLTRAYGVF